MRLRLLGISAAFVLLCLSQAFGAISLDLVATYRERAPTVSSTTGDPESDDWGVSVTGAATGFYISSLTWTLPTVPADVVYDTNTLSGKGLGKGWGGAFGYVLVSGPAGAVSVVDGGKTLGLSFGVGVFEAGDSLSYTIDVDNSNVTVRGWGFGGSNGAIGGTGTESSDPPNPYTRRAKLDISYFDGFGLSSVSTYFYGTGIVDAGTAEARATLAYEPAGQPAVPEPASVVIWGVGGLCAAAAACRRRKGKQQPRWSEETRNAIYAVVHARPE